MNNHQKAYYSGLLGEDTAERYLTAAGMICIERRYHSPYGEIDLIMLDQEVLVFVEVKSRARGTIQTAQAAVTAGKQRKIIQTALCYLNAHPEHSHRMMRFDIVSLAAGCIDHLENAFQGSGW